MASSRKAGRFGFMALSFIAALALLGVAISAVGFMRITGNEGGGLTLLAGGLLLLLVDFAVVVGLATTRVARVEKTYHRVPAMVGHGGIVKERIPANGRGVVLVQNELWTASSERELPPGTRIKIVKTDGILLYVEGETP
ncbi:MAG TPA: NfeD family protein [Conexivisphaerales archaeon]|nr:NfeD family protein [Conexivisphaerales archaeon]